MLQRSGHSAGGTASWRLTYCAAPTDTAAAGGGDGAPGAAIHRAGPPVAARLVCVMSNSLHTAGEKLEVFTEHVTITAWGKSRLRLKQDNLLTQEPAAVMLQIWHLAVPHGAQPSTLGSSASVQ